MKVLVYGATGSQMSPLVELLATNGDQVVGFSKGHSQNVGIIKGVSYVNGDMGDAELILSSTKGIDAVALHVPFFGDPSKSFEYAKNAIDAALKSNVKMLVWNTSGTIPPAPTGNPSIDFRIEAYKYLQASGLNYVVLAPTVYAENLLSPWSTIFLKTKNQISYPTPIDYHLGWLPTLDLAEMISYSLRHLELSGRHFNVSGVKPYNGNDLAEAFTEALGKKVTYYPMPPKEFGKILDNVIGAPGAGDAASSFYQAEILH